ncbi:MAG: CPBP family intramembrane glutamic endopeptidase [Flavisolibacter sp.]
MTKSATSKILAYVTTLIVMLAVTLTLFSPIPGTLKLIIRIILILSSFISWNLFQKHHLTTAKDLAFAFMALNLAFLVVSFFTPSFWNLDQHTPKGLALIKLSDAAFISSALILFFVIGGYKLKNIYLARGRLIPGLVIGVLFFLVFGYLAINNPQRRIETDFLSKNYAWILVFIFANAFMEELLFRGIFLEKLNRYMRPAWAIILTSISFAVPHLTVGYAPDVLIFTGFVFVLGLICGLAMHYTKSIIAPMLIHAGADLLIIIQVFASYAAIK